MNWSNDGIRAAGALGDGAVDLVGGDVHEPVGAVAQGRVQQGLGAEHVGAHELGGAGQGPVHMGLGGEVHHHVVRSDQLIDQLGVADIALDQREPVLGKSIERAAVARVGEEVEHGDRVVGVVEDMTDEVRADKSRPAGDQESAACSPVYIVPIVRGLCPYYFHR